MNYKTFINQDTEGHFYWIIEYLNLQNDFKTIESDVWFDTKKDAEIDLYNFLKREGAL